MVRLTMKYLALAALLAACTDGGAPTESVCPPTAPPTYAAFGKPFFDTYCMGCHSASATNRHGAPRSQNYDTEADIRSHAAQIDLQAAAGPGSVNTSMPDLSGPVHTEPTDAEREQLGQYLACVRAAP